MDRPGVGTGVIVFKGKQVLLGKRLKKDGHGTWHFPGGRMEFGEDFIETGIRETKEETNVDIKDVQFLTVTNDIFHETKDHYITLFLVAKYAGGEVKDMEPEKAGDWSWYDYDKLPEPYYLPVKNLLKQNIDFSQYADK